MNDCSAKCIVNSDTVKKYAQEIWTEVEISPVIATISSHPWKDVHHNIHALNDQHKRYKVLNNITGIIIA